MANSKNKKHININAETVERFEYIFPRIKEIFIERALLLALQDKNFFEEVFFNPQFIEVK